MATTADSPALSETTSLPQREDRGVDSFSVARISNPSSFSGLVSEVRRIAKESNGQTFVTLDDVDQCLYTSGHAVEFHELAEDIEYPEPDSPANLQRYDTERFERVLAS